MNWGEIFDPTGHNFLGAGDKFGRILGDLMTLGQGEFFRPDPFGMGRHTVGGKVGHGIGGAAQGGVGGFFTGGLPGAVVGGTTGGVRSGLGDSEPWTLAGRGGGGLGNFGIGAGEGVVLSGMGSLIGKGGGGAMVPYIQTSAPGSMGSAGITTGPGGMFSPLNPMSSSPVLGASKGPSSLATAFKLMRMLPRGGQQGNGAQQRQDQEMQMRLIYQMFPNLKPGASLHGGV